MEKKKNLPPLRPSEQRLSYEEYKKETPLSLGINPWVLLFIIFIVAALIYILWRKSQTK